MNSPPTSAVRCVIADDERLMREQLRARLNEVWPELQIVAEAKNGSEAVALVAEHRPELVFLDIRMPGLTGVEAARQIAQMDVGDDELSPRSSSSPPTTSTPSKPSSRAWPTMC